MERRTMTATSTASECSRLCDELKQSIKVFIDEFDRIDEEFLRMTQETYRLINEDLDRILIEDLKPLIDSFN